MTLDELLDNYVNLVKSLGLSSTLESDADLKTEFFATVLEKTNSSLPLEPQYKKIYRQVKQQLIQAKKLTDSNFETEEEKQLRIRKNRLKDKLSKL